MMITPSAEDKKDANKHERATTNNKVATSSSSSSRHWSSAGFRNPRIVRVSRSFGGKDRHSKVCTVRGLRDRRIRLSVPTAVQLYDLQDRLGLGQPSKVIDWLIDNTKPDIDNLPPLHFPPQFHHHNHPLDNNLNTKPLTTDDFSFFPHKTHFSSPTNISPYLGLGQLGMFPQIIDSSSSSSSTSSASSSSSLSPSLFFGGQLLGNPTPYTTATDHQTTMMMMMIGHDQMAAARSTSSRMINVINNNNNNSSTGLSGHVLQNYSLMPPSSSDINIEAPSSSIRSIFTGPRFLSQGGFESRHGKDHHG